jgi:5-methylcytosine-specific restriction endonuclease McrA
VDVAEVYRRDRNICHVCGKFVPKGERSLDHLVPLSRGGVHSMSNVALAHGRCNSKRFNTGPAQLLLFHEAATV